jgi:hypothetical protein
MRNKMLFLIVSATLVSGCVLTDQIRYRKNMATLPAIEADSTEEQSENQIILEKWEEEETLPLASANTLEDSVVWYHPNDWWRIKTARFPDSPDSMQYRMFRPQYGATTFRTPQGAADRERWRTWQVTNRIYNEPQYGGHMWSGFIKARKNIFTQHPEYLAEVDGKRLGYGVSGKLCVSNKEVQKLFCDYAEEVATKNIQRIALSVEPSDGGKFCSCSECKKLGSISNQVFFLANEVAKRFKKQKISTKVYLYAYNLHSEIPGFILEDNITVQVIPRGFQRIYQPEVMMSIWGAYHSDLFYRDYFGIPQWTGDMPRIQVPTILQRTNLAFKYNYRAIVMESGANINAAILFVLFNALWMNPELTYEDVLDKFIDDCFPSSKVPMRRLFYRWHHSWLKEDEMKASLYDLKEAKDMTQDKAELLRIKDLIVYVNLMGHFLKFSANTEDKSLVDQYFNHVYRAASHNVANSLATSTMYSKFLRPFPDLNEKYKKENVFKTWAKPYSDQEIEADFRRNIQNFGTQLIDYKYRTPFDFTPEDFLESDYLQNVETRMTNNSELNIISRTDLLKITAEYTANEDSPLLISVFDQDLDFVDSRYVDNNQTIEVKLPKPGTYTISYHRANVGFLKISGSIIPVLAEGQANARIKYYNINHKGQWQPVTKGKNILETTNFYYQLNRQ